MKPLIFEHVQREIAATRKLPVAPLFDGLFRNRDMFGSNESFCAAGFKPVERSPDHKFIVGRHPAAKGYLFKKYMDDRPEAAQIRHYMLRIECAGLLRTFIDERHFQGVVVPKKWLYELPENFPRRYLVIAEALDLASRDATKREYARISKAQMQELATILFYFRGLTSGVNNLPFTKDGKIAFIDTARWSEDRKYLFRIEDVISSKRRDLAMSTRDELIRQGQQRIRSRFE